MMQTTKKVSYTLLILCSLAPLYTYGKKTGKEHGSTLKHAIQSLSSSMDQKAIEMFLQGVHADIVHLPKTSKKQYEVAIQLFLVEQAIPYLESHPSKSTAMEKLGRRSLILAVGSAIVCLIAWVIRIHALVWLGSILAILGSIVCVVQLVYVAQHFVQRVSLIQELLQKYQEDLQRQQQQKIMNKRRAAHTYGT